MQAVKLKGTVNEAGKLILAESVDLAPGEVEIILLKPASSSDNSSVDTKDEARRIGEGEHTFKTKIKALENWFEKVPPVSQDFDADEARWQALKEKYNL